MLNDKAILVLSDGSRFDGYAYAAGVRVVGELMVETGVVGFQEVLSAESSAKKIVLFTTPHVGITGANDADSNGAVRAGGLVVRDPARVHSNFRAERDFVADLNNAGVSGIYGVDTRAIARLATGKNLRAGIFSGQDLELSDAEQLEIVRNLGLGE